MSIAPYPASAIHVKNEPFTLVSFDREAASLVASWVHDAHELFWLAPKTPAPLTAQKVIDWPGPDGSAVLLYRDGAPEPIGYAELNPMPGQVYQLWIGHCVIRPELRTQGIGRHFVEMLLRDAFVNRYAISVSLVVFPDNVTAVRCYRASGFLHIREQTKYMATTGRRHCMIEMRVMRAQYAARHPGMPSFPA